MIPLAPPQTNGIKLNNRRVKMIRKCLKEIENSAFILLLIGVILNFLLNQRWGVWTIAIGLALWVIQVVYKAFNWKKYSADNKKNIAYMIVVIVLLTYKMLVR
jgi:dipeptide/tripeptide permease